MIGEFLDRIGSAIDARVDARVQATTFPAAPPPPVPNRQPSVALGIVSVVAGFLITPIVLGTTKGSLGGIIVMIVSWGAIAAVNAAYYTRRK